VRHIVGWRGSLLFALVSEVCWRQADGDGGLSGEYAEKLRRCHPGRPGTVSSPHLAGSGQVPAAGSEHTRGSQHGGMARLAGQGEGACACCRTRPERPLCGNGRGMRPVREGASGGHDGARRRPVCRPCRCGGAAWGPRPRGLASDHRARAGTAIVGCGLVVPAVRPPAPVDVVTARQVLLSGLAGEAALPDLLGRLEPLHPRNSTFPERSFSGWPPKRSPGPAPAGPIRSRWRGCGSGPA